MASLVPVRRVTIIADSGLEDKIIEQCMKLGAKGYNVAHCRGKGKHDLIDDFPLARQSAEVRIEVLAQDSVADAIFELVNQAPYNNYALTAYMDEVLVASNERF